MMLHRRIDKQPCCKKFCNCVPCILKLLVFRSPWLSGTNTIVAVNAPQWFGSQTCGLCVSYQGLGPGAGGMSHYPRKCMFPNSRAYADISRLTDFLLIWQSFGTNVFWRLAEAELSHLPWSLVEFVSLGELLMTMMPTFTKSFSDQIAKCGRSCCQKGNFAQ